MSGKICPLMSRVNDARVEEVMCFEGSCQMWEAQTGTCGLATQGFLDERGQMNEGIEAAFERVAAIEERRQGHVVESSLGEKESKFEADIQDILGLLMQAEGEYHQGHFSMVLALVKDVRRKLVVLANREREK